MMKARVSQLHNTAAAWEKFAEWVPTAGELVVYDPDEKFSYARVKIGDGKRPLKNLSFFTDSAISEYLSKWRYFTLIDAGRVTDYKK